MTIFGDTSPGRRVKAARQHAGLSLRGLADKTGISPSYLSKLENAEKTNPSAEILQRIAETLSLSLHELLGDGSARTQGDLPELRDYLCRKFGVSADKADAIAVQIEETLNIT
ncbi:helix-turn-helix transcriptional regulator [Streptomyces sp. NPDC048489]|uniref:helix-turn-helix domain-containing protein n=1 Tax=Streptomyces sp. NPDC048489 TaxID=3154504 RepID=UPI0034187F5C